MDESNPESDITLVEHAVSISTLTQAAEEGFGDMVKAVVDVELSIMAFGGELHADEEAFLLSRGSTQQALWGINLYPGAYGGPDFVEFDSMINLRPAQGNRSRSVEDPAIRSRILRIVDQLVVGDG